MNIGAHIAVAAGLHERRLAGSEPADPGELLGSTLPDVAAMGRFRLLGSTGHGGVRAGIQLHYRTDEVFHRHPWFQRRQGALVDDLSRRGFARGPAMACGHVGIELLLDGVLLAGRPTVAAAQRAFDAIPRLRSQLGGLVGEVHRDRWLTHLDRFAGQPPLRDLDDPAEVAGRLYRILAGRPRLAFDRHLIPALTDTLAAHRPGVADDGAELVDELVEALYVGETGDGFDAPWAATSPV